MLGATRPLDRRKRFKACDELPPISYKPRQRCLEVHTQEKVIGILIAGQVWPDQGHWGGQDVVKSLEKERVNMAQVARMLVRGPAPQGGSALEDLGGDFSDEGHDNVWRTTQGVDDCRNAFHVSFNSSLESLLEI